MNRTTLLVRRADMPRKPLEHCHGGTGALDWVGVLGKRELEGRRLRFLHDDVLPPGVSIGIHEHTSEEYYLVLAGRGVVTLDGAEHEVSPGDVAAVFPGGSHGLENRGDEELRIVVVGIG